MDTPQLDRAAVKSAVAGPSGVRDYPALSLKKGIGTVVPGLPHATQVGRELYAGC